MIYTCTLYSGSSGKVEWQQKLGQKQKNLTTVTMSRKAKTCGSLLGWYWGRIMYAGFAISIRFNWIVYLSGWQNYRVWCYYIGLTWQYRSARPLNNGSNDTGRRQSSVTRKTWSGSCRIFNRLKFRNNFCCTLPDSMYLGKIFPNMFNTLIWKLLAAGQRQKKYKKLKKSKRNTLVCNCRSWTIP